MVRKSIERLNLNAGSVEFSDEKRLKMNTKVSPKFENNEGNTISAEISKHFSGIQPIKLNFTSPSQRIEKKNSGSSIHDTFVD